MRKLRLLFLVLAVALLVPTALVVRRAFESAGAERRMVHRDVADRIADEMERELTGWLAGEEDRPFAHYRFFHVPDGAGTGDRIPLERSPLSEPPRDPFVICYFQIEPDGTVSSPLWPGNEILAAATGWRASPELHEVATLARDVARDLWSTREAPLDVEAARSRDDRLELLAGGAEKALDLEPPATALEEDLRSKLLGSLNRGAATRSERPTKITPSQAANVYNFSQDQTNVLQSRVQGIPGLDDAVERDAGARRQAEDEPALWTTVGEVASDIEAALATGALDAIDVLLEPMVGRRVTASHLMLYRTVQIGEGAYRQGLVLDVAMLLDWLEERVLAGNELAAYASAEDEEVETLADYAFPHRFAEPFGAVRARISLATLPDARGDTDLVLLSGLLVAAITLGLLALYRMVGVRLAYAQRRSNFVSAVTHELKTPLTAIRMYAEMLRDGVVPEESRRHKYYEILTAESERLGRLVQNVLELSRLERNQREVQLVTGDLRPVLEEALQLLGPHADKAGFTLELDVEPGLPQATYDRDALLQVLFNLVDNALKYARRADQKSIFLSCRRHGDGVLLTVADRGPGVARKHVEKIFEPFYRGENELTRTVQGTGIGLALVRGLVERMGGTVRGRTLRQGGFEVAISLGGGSP